MMAERRVLWWLWLGWCDCGECGEERIKRCCGLVVRIEISEQVWGDGALFSFHSHKFILHKDCYKMYQCVTNTMQWRWTITGLVSETRKFPKYNSTLSVVWMTSLFQHSAQDSMWLSTTTAITWSRTINHGCTIGRLWQGLGEGIAWGWCSVYAWWWWRRWRLGGCEGGGSLSRAVWCVVVTVFILSSEILSQSQIFSASIRAEWSFNLMIRQVSQVNIKWLANILSREGERDVRREVTIKRAEVYIGVKIVWCYDWYTTIE